MLYAWIDGVKRAPIATRERTVCQDCGAILLAVVPIENIAHWRHKSGDCDVWSEPEGPWHLGWKEFFGISCRELVLHDVATGERHRADVLCALGTPKATVLELQHSAISEDERSAREAFYRRDHRMFWLVHIHSENSFLAHNFAISIDFRTRPFQFDGKSFAVMRWMGSNNQFIEKWKRASAHVFFDWGGRILYLANESVSRYLGAPFKRGEFALCELTREEFVRAVQWQD